MISEIVDSCEAPRDGPSPAPRRHGWRRSALAAASPLLLGGAAVGAVATSTPDETSAASMPAQPHLSPAATPCPTPRMMPRAGSVPSALLANHQPCNHHEGMVTAFRWL